MGKLKAMYSQCDIAFIGGSFNKTGGHNPLEASIYNKPVISGSSIFNFKDIYAILTSSNAAKTVKSSNELYCAIDELLSDENKYHQVCLACDSVFKFLN